MIQGIVATQSPQSRIDTQAYAGYLDFPLESEEQVSALLVAIAINRKTPARWTR